MRGRRATLRIHVQHDFVETPLRRATFAQGKHHERPEAAGDGWWWVALGMWRWVVEVVGCGVGVLQCVWRMAMTQARAHTDTA